MTRPRAYRRLLDLGLGGRARVDAEMDLEIESHIAMRIADLVREGLRPDEARAEAMRRFGNFDAARERLHSAARQRDAAMRQRDVKGSIVSDLRYAMRQVRRAPGFTMLAVATLALGIGATTAMFTLVERVLLRPLPFPFPEQLVSVTGLDSARNKVPMVSSADWLDWRRARSMQAMAIYSFPFRQGILVGDSAVRVDAERVSGNYFEVLRPRFVAGRAFTEEEVMGGATVAVISEGLWRRMFAADPRLSRPLRTATTGYTIVGVIAAGQEFPARTDAWFPVAFTTQMDPARVNVNWRAIGRMRPDVTAEQVIAEVGTIARGIRATDPSAIYDYGAGVESLSKSVIGDVSTYLELLMGVVLFVLLIVCANVAASGLARAASRSREMAIRASLGAARSRLIQQLLIEHVWLGLLGGAFGLFIAWATIKLILAQWGEQIPRAHEISMDGRVFLFALAASLVAGLMAGTVPALRVSQVSLRSMLSSGGRTAAKGGRNLAGASLVSLEIALALLLLTGAGLLIRSFRSVLGRDIGFETNVATAEVNLRAPMYLADTLRRYAYWTALVDAYQTIPGVEAAGVANWIPLGLTGQSFIDIYGRQDSNIGAVYRSVSEGFFRALRIPLVVGRTFDAQDGSSTPRVVVINRAMAAKYWPGENPIGKLVRARSMEAGPRGTPAAWLTIIGVVGDVRTYGLESRPQPEMYVYYRQTPSWTITMTAVVRGTLPADRLLGEMRRRAVRIDPRIAADVGTLGNRLRDTLATRVLTMSLLSGFAGIAMVLAALGIYGVLSYSVAQRTGELAVRAALGARRGQLLRLVLAAGLRVVGLGMILGLIAALWLTRALKSMLVEVSSVDPLAFFSAVATLFIVSVAAILIPSLRATRLNPNIALQAE